jgi:surface protein
MKKILFILLLITSFANAQSSFKDAEHEFVPACNNGKSIILGRFWFHINAVDTVWRTYYFDSTGKSYTPTGSVTLGFCYKADTALINGFKRITDSLHAINMNMVVNNLQNDTIINKLDSSNYYLKDIASKSVVDTSMKATISLFQVKDCAGANVGSPEVVQKTIVLNKINASICNAGDFKDTSANAILRAIKTNLADSLRTYDYSYQIQNNKQNDSLIKRMDSLLANSGGDTSINPTLRLLQKNVYDSLRTFNYSYLDTTNARLLQMVGKTYFDSSWYVHLRGIQKNIADSLRTYNYKYDSINIVRNDSILALMKGDTANLDDYGSSFQVQDCAGANVGTPQNVLKTVVLNKVIASICNTADFKGDTSINSVLRAMQKNLADSLRIFRFQYSYFDSLQATADALLAKTTFDSSWYSVLRDIRTNVKDSLRTFKYSYIDTTNARLAELLLKQFADTSINSVIRLLQKNVADSLRLNTMLILEYDRTYCGTSNGVSKEYKIRQFSEFNQVSKIKTLKPIEYSTDGMNWVTTITDSTTFVLGTCPIVEPEPYCIENVSYHLTGNRGIVLEKSKIFEYKSLVYAGSTIYTEKNKVLKGDAGWEWGNGDVVLRELLKNDVIITNTTSTTDTRISVMQICGYEPIQADAIDGGLVLLASAVPNATNDSILVKFNDVPAATGYRVFRYVKGANPNTKIQLTDWTEGTANSNIVNNGDGTYTYKDGTAVLGTDYMYYYEAYNSVSQGFSNTTEASLLPTSFEPVMRTTAANELVTLPMTVSSPVTIDWGDGTTTTQGAPFTKVYATPGDYHIKVKITASKEVSNFMFNLTGDRLKLIDIKNWGWVKLGPAGRNFYGCDNLVTITAKDVPTGLTNMNYMFANCSKLSTIDKLADWNTSNVTNMAFTFYNCSVFNQSISNFNTANVTDFTYMFGNARLFNQSVSNFNTAKATSFAGMFLGAWVFNQSVSNFNTALVTRMDGMFGEAYKFNQSVSNFNTANVTNMFSMFRNAWAFNQSVSNFVTDKVTTMGQMFSLAKVFNQSVSNFNTANVTDFGGMFTNAALFNQPVPFNTVKATNMGAMFARATAFNQAINFSIPLVSNMFDFIGLSGMNTTNVDNMLINFAGQTTKSNINLNLFRPRTTVSDAAKATLVSRGWSASGW